MTRRDLPRYLVDQRDPDERIRDLEAQVAALRETLRRLIRTSWLTQGE